MSLLRLSSVKEGALTSVSTAAAVPWWSTSWEMTDNEVVLEADDDLSSIRGIVASAVLSLPVWFGVGVIVWKLVH